MKPSGVDGGACAVGGQASIGDSALIPVLDREAAQQEPLHARMIVEQLPALPRP